MLTSGRFPLAASVREGRFYQRFITSYGFNIPDTGHVRDLVSHPQQLLSRGTLKRAGIDSAASDPVNAALRQMAQSPEELLLCKSLEEVVQVVSRHALCAALIFAGRGKGEASLRHRGQLSRATLQATAKLTLLPPRDHEESFAV